MTLRSGTAWIFLAIVILGGVTLSYSQDQFRLKPGAKGQICLKCHEIFKEKLKLPFLHTPVKRGDCSDCHNPHTSSHGKLLAGDPSRICVSCHDGIVPGKARSTHKVVLEGNCVACHDPHAAKNANNLRLAGNDLCFSCHKKVAKEVADSRYKHQPVEKGCVSCHNPHASSDADFLLTSTVPGVCIACHKPDKPAFAKQHMGYPVEKGRCNSCHSPHGSSNKGILWADVHRPVSSRMCAQCHEESSSPNALSTRKPGFELCRGCHNDMLNETFLRNRVHWPLVDRISCLNCHEPHASRERSLLAGPMIQICGKCHKDTLRRQERSLVKHEPIRDGECAKCHTPHSSNTVFLLDNTNLINVCGTCHEWQKHSTHPIGEKVVDKRNQNVTLDCASCHRSHGSEFKIFAPYDTKMDLCVQCHEQFRR